MANTAALTSIPPGIPIGGDAASPGDIAAFDALYGFPPRGVLLSTQPPGGALLVDGERVETPAIVDLAAGKHTLEWPEDAYADISPETRHIFTRWSTGEITPQIRVEIDAETRWIGAAARVEHHVYARSGNTLRGDASVSPAQVGGWFLQGTTVTATATPATSGHRFGAWLDNLGAWVGDPPPPPPDHRIQGHSPVTWRVTRPLGLVAQWEPASAPHVLIGGRREVPGAEPENEASMASFDLEYATGAEWTRTRAPMALTPVGASQLAVRWVSEAEPASGRRLLFQHWSDGIGAEEREVEIPTRGGMRLDAVFREECLLRLDMDNLQDGAPRPLERNAAAIRVQALWDGPQQRRLWRLVTSPGGDVWLPCGSDVVIEALAPEDARLNFSHWRGTRESASQTVRLRLEHGAALSAAYTRWRRLPTREALLRRARTEPVAAEPAGLSFSGIAEEGGIPAQERRFRGRGETVTVSCAVQPPTGAVRLGPAAFSVSAREDVAVSVTASGEGLLPGSHALRIECDAGGEDALRIPVALWLAARD